MRALTPLPLTLAGVSVLIITTLGTADIILIAASKPLPTPIRQWMIGIALGSIFISTVVIAARWVVQRLEKAVGHMSRTQIEEVCGDPLMSETIASIVGPQITAWTEYQTLNRRRLRAVADEDE